MDENKRLDVLDKGYVRFVDSMGDDRSVVNGARVSYQKESAEWNTNDKGLLNFLYKNGHHSPFRHASISFEIKAPLMVCRQWLKHVVGSSHLEDGLSWNESSRRYVTSEPEFYEPEEWRSTPKNSKQGSGEPFVDGYLTAMLQQHTDDGVHLYQEAMNRGVAPEQARLFLPAYGMYILWRWSASLAGVMSFLDQRLEEHAQYEIREYAAAVKEITLSHFPESMEVMK